MPRFQLLRIFSDPIRGIIKIYVDFSHYLITVQANILVQVGKDHEKAQSEKDSHSKNRGGKEKTNNQVLIP